MNDDYLRRVPPQNLEAESSVLGAVFIEQECLASIWNTLEVEDFYRESHRKIYRAMMELCDAGVDIDLITLSDYLKNKNDLKEIGGSAYLAALNDFTPTAANVEHYADIVKKRASQRELFRLFGDGIDNVQSEDPQALISKITSRLAKLGTKGNGHNRENHHSIGFPPRTFSESRTQKSRGFWKGILPAGGMSLLVAKPKVGKTTLALNLAIAVSRGADFLGRKTTQGPVVYLALEEKKGEIKKKLKQAGSTDEPSRFHFGSATVNAIQEVEFLMIETKAILPIMDVLQKFCRLRDLNDYTTVTNPMPLSL